MIEGEEENCSSKMKPKQATDGGTCDLVEESVGLQFS